MIPTTKRIQAIFTAVPAIPVRPNTAAMIAMTRKTAGTPIIALKRATTHQLDHTSIAIFGMQVWQYLFFQVREGLI